MEEIETVEVKAEATASVEEPKDRKYRGKKRARVWRPKAEVVDTAPVVATNTVVERETTKITTEEDSAMEAIISDATLPDMTEWEKTYVGIREKGNIYDFAQRLYPFNLPDECMKLKKSCTYNYEWHTKEQMEIRCDPSRVFYVTPVNRSNHRMLPDNMFNKNGGIYREGQYLTFMPWRMYQAMNDVKMERAKGPQADFDAKYKRPAETGGYYDPQDGGRNPGAARPGDVVVHEMHDEHPSEIYESVGETE
jgi:hypothetical protein